MSKPVVAIVGRPNVGKSTLFNKIVGKRISIEEGTPGVTRDRISAQAQWLGYSFTLLDTGGLIFHVDDHMVNAVGEQTNIAVDMADVILFVVDYKEGVTSGDIEVAHYLRKTQKPVLLLVNKVDSFQRKPDLYEFYELGYEPLPLSAANSLNLGDILDEIVSLLPKKVAFEEDDMTKVAIVGRPNVGKSSLLNRLIGEERTIVSPVAGTTRDAIDVDVMYHGKPYRFIDTAGIRRRKKVNENIEHYSVLRAYKAIERSDIAILVVDATTGFAEQDKKIIGHAHNNGKSIIVLMNKWDLVEKDSKTYQQMKREFYMEFPFLKYAFFDTISVFDDVRIHRIMETILKIDENRHRRIPTGQLNDVINEAVLRNVTPSDKGVRLKIYYGTQIDVNPPRFLIFVNKKRFLHFSYVRYLENTLRSRYEFSGTPIEIIARERGEES